MYMRNKDKAIYETINNILKNNESITTINNVANMVGVSNSTVSRYVRRRGFENFGAMKVYLNRSSGTDERLKPFFKIIKENEDFFVTSSVGATPIASRIKRHLKKIGKNIHNGPTQTSKNIIVSIMGETSVLSKYIGTFDFLIITTRDAKYPKNSIKIIIDDLNPLSTDYYDVANAIADLQHLVDKNFIKWMKNNYL